MTHDATVDALRAVLPDDVVLTGAAVDARLTDASATPPRGVPAAVVRPRGTADVSAALAVAHRLHAPVVPQGTLSGLAGGATAVEGAVLLDMSGMDAVLRVDVDDQVAVVQAGVVVADLARAAAEHGLFYAPDPASASWATVGGTIATNAGGMRCLKYGVTRDAVRSLEVVLADGEVVRTRPPTVKAVAGYDLTGLVVGSEGTLAVVTEATLHLLPAPGPLRGVSGTFATVADAVRAANAVMAGPHRPCTLEVLDAVVLAAIRAHDPAVDLPSGAGAWLVALTDARSGADDDVAAYRDSFVAHGAIGLEHADSPERVAELMRARRSFHHAMKAVRGGLFAGDVAVPRSRLVDLVAGLAAVGEQTGTVIGAGGHVGDGNLHPSIAYDPSDPRQVEAVAAAHHQMLALAQELGGTATGEHGIGTEKLAALDGELGPRVRQLQRGIKAVLDPHGILNPGTKV